jgi:replicative DNA helicase
VQPVQLFDDAAERIVLGAMMLADSAIDDVAEILTTRDFHRRAHEVIYARLIAHSAAGEPTDPQALGLALDAAGDLASVGGLVYLFELVRSVPTVANAGWYARHVAGFAARRRIVEAAAAVTVRAQSLDRDLADVVNDTQRIVLEATAPRQRTNVTPLSELLSEADSLLDGNGPGRGLSTGLGALDEVIGGLKPGQLILFAGRPGAGKSVLCVDVARAATRRMIPALVVSLEMHRREILARIFAAEAGVDLYRLLNGGLDFDERARIRQATAQLRPQPMHIDTTRSSDLGVIRTTARKIQARHGLGLLVVDYLQLMTPARRQDNRVQELGEISRGLKLLAGDLDIPVVAAAQLNRSAEARTDRRPQLSDLRESGALEQDSDIVILIHRPDYHDPEHERAGQVDLIVAKNRNGPQQTVTAAAHLEFSRFVDIGV